MMIINLFDVRGIVHWKFVPPGWTVLFIPPARPLSALLLGSFKTSGRGWAEETPGKLAIR